MNGYSWYCEWRVVVELRCSKPNEETVNNGVFISNIIICASVRVSRKNCQAMLPRLKGVGGGAGVELEAARVRD